MRKFKLLGCSQCTALLGVKTCCLAPATSLLRHTLQLRPAVATRAPLAPAQPTEELSPKTKPSRSGEALRLVHTEALVCRQVSLRALCVPFSWSLQHFLINTTDICAIFLLVPLSRDSNRRYLFQDNAAKTDTTLCFLSLHNMFGKNVVSILRMWMVGLWSKTFHFFIT